MLKRPLQRPLVHLLEAVAVALIVAVAAGLRFANLPNNPAWYSDEGTWAQIAQHFAADRDQYMAVSYPTLLVGRPPLFLHVVAALYRVTDSDGLPTLRALTAGLGVLSVLLLYLCVRQVTGDAALALLAAALLALYPRAVLFNRIGFSYNLLQPLMVVVVWLLWHALSAARAGHRRVWLGAAALCVGVGGLSDLAALGVLLPLAVVVLWRDWRDLWAVALGVVPLALFLLVSWWTIPQVIAFDAAFTFGRAATPVWEQAVRAADNVGRLLFSDAWLVLALIGFFAPQPPRLQRLTALLLWPYTLLIVRLIAADGVGGYYLIPIWPLVALGVALCLYYGAHPAYAVLRDTLGACAARVRAVPLPAWAVPVGARVALAALMVGPCVALTTTHWNALADGWPTDRPELFLVPSDARAVIDYLHAQARPTDLVIASPSLTWALNTRTADFQIAAAYAGIRTIHWPPDLPRARFLYPAGYADARFVVIDPLWRTWAADNVTPATDGQPNAMRVQMAQIEATWTRVFAAGEIVVYEQAAAR
jgi:hypothetical protein